MYCINPIVIEGRGIFPCGQCRFCRVVRQNQWALRMMHERECWVKASYITLTYNDYNLPSDGSLKKEDLQKFVKRLRQMVKPNKIKYYACGEYGETYGRPHYHMIVFGIGISDRKLIEKEWSMGFCRVAPVTYKTCRYVAKYVTKALLGKSRRDKYLDTKAQPFQVASRGLGLSWVVAHTEELGRRGLLYHGRLQAMPRYYIDKLRKAGVSDQVFEDLKYDRVYEQMQQSIREINAGLSGAERAELHEAQRGQRIEELRTKDSMYKGVDNQ